MSINLSTDARIRLSLDGVQQVESGLARVQSVAGGAARALAGIAGGVFSAKAFYDWIKGAIDAADETNKLTQKTGLLAEQVAGLKLAFELGGAGDSFAGSLARLAKEAVGGNKAFAAMGISVSEAGGKLKTTRDLLSEVANAFAGYRDGPEKAALAMEIFGKAGADLIPVLNGGAKSFAEMDAKAKELGLTIDGDMAAAAEKFNDDLEIMSSRISGVAISLAGPILSGLNGLIDKFREGSAEGESFFLTLMKQTGAAYFLGQDKVANGYTDTRVELERLNLALASGKLNVTQTLALEEKRTELAKKMAGYLSGTANGRRGAEDPSNIMRGELPRAPIVGGVPKPRTTKASKADRDEFADLLNRVSMKDIGLDPSFYKDLETLYAGYQKGRVGVDEYREAVEALVTSQKFAQDLSRAREQSLATEAELLTIVAAKDREWAEQIQQRNQYAQQMVDQIEFETGLLGLNSQERERAVSLRELERLGIEKGTEAYLKYGAALEKAMLDRQQREATLQLWNDVNSAAENAFMDIALNGEDAFKRIGESIKREVLQLLYEMTIKKWIFQIAGVSGGSGGGTNWIDMATQAYQAYSGGGGGGLAGLFGGGTAAAGGASAYGSSYAAGSVSSSAMVSTGSSAAAGSASTSMMAYMGYAALIAAAVMVAENLYAKGYTRMALGEGGSETAKFGQYSSYQTDANVQKSWMSNSPAMLMTNDMRKFNDALGMSSKWADILSGTTRMATLVGRKLSAYGYQADIAGGDSETSGFARYKGGVFRSNKTVKADVDPRDAAAFDAIVESTIEGSRAMARAMGYSDDAINKYTGSLKVNFKNADTAAEQAERMAEAMDELQFSLLKAAAGGKYSREEFDKMMEGVRAAIEAAGISTAGIADILVQGMTGRLSQADVGDQLSEVIVGGIYNAIASNYAGVIAQAFTSQIITPIFTALAAGVPISQAISQAAIDNVVATANNAAAAMNVIFNDPGFRQAIAGIESAISGVSSAVTRVKAPAYGGRAARNTAADQSAQQRYGLEAQLLQLLGRTDTLRQRELASLSSGNRALQMRIWALEDSKQAVDGAMDALNRAIEAQRELLTGRLDAARETESSLNDVFGLLKDNITDLRGEVVGGTDMSAARAREAIRAAIGGTPMTSDALAQAIGQVRTTLEEANYATRFERDRATLAFAGELNTLAGVTEKSLSAAEQQVTLLESQLSALDLQAEAAQKQVDALMGVDTSVKTVDASVRALTLAMAGYSASVAAAAAIRVSSGAAPSGSSGGGGFSGGSSSGSGATASGWTAAGYWSKNADLRAEYENLLRQDPSQADKRFNLDPAISYRDEYLKWHWESIGKNERRKFARGGFYPGGMALVGEEGPELINFKNPGMVYTAAQSQNLLGGGEETARLLKQLISDHREFRFAMVAEIKTLNKLHKKWDGDGLPETREVSA